MRSPSSTAGPTTTARPPRRTVCRATICSPRLRARRSAFAEQEKPAYVYRFTRPAPGSDPIKVGAFHSAELAYVFGTQASIDRPWSDRDCALSEQMQQYWTNFAKTGDPNGPGLPEWPRYGASAQEAMELGDATRAIPVLDPQRKALFDAYLATRLSK